MCICLRPIIYVIARRNCSHQHRTSSTVIRDIEFLSRYAPIYTKQGMFGGIFVFDEYRKNLLLPLSDDEEGLLKKLSENLDGKELHLINTIISKYSKPKIST